MYTYLLIFKKCHCVYCIHNKNIDEMKLIIKVFYVSKLHQKNKLKIYEKMIYHNKNKLNPTTHN